MIVYDVEIIPVVCRVSKYVITCISKKMGLFGNLEGMSIDFDDIGIFLETFLAPNKLSFHDFLATIKILFLNYIARFAHL